MDTYISEIRKYWRCIIEKAEYLSKNNATCKNRLINSIKEFINNSFNNFLKNNITLINANILIRARARLVYRARPGSGEFLLPLEWGLLVHPVFMIPYFPGSAVKGVMRASYQSMVERYLESTNIGVDEEEKKRVIEGCAEAFFGSTKEDLAGIGGVVAFDAYPVAPGRGGVVVGDVLTPHYGGSSGRVVTELDAQPKPIQGISVAEDTVFEFLVGVDPDYIRERIHEKWREYRDYCLLGGNDPVTIVAASLLNALTRMGIGGKTTRGYGFFQVAKLEQITMPTSSRTLLKICSKRW